MADDDLPLPPSPPNAHGVQALPRGRVPAEDWDRFVDECGGAWFYHLSALQNALTTWPHRTDLSRAYVSGAGELLAVLPLHTERVRALGAPLGRVLASLGGPALRPGLDPTVARAVVSVVRADLQALARTLHALEARAHLSVLAPDFRDADGPRVNPLLAWGYEETAGYSWLIDLGRPEATLWDGMEGRARNAIRKAEKNGVTVRWEPRPGDADLYHALHIENYRRTETPPHPRAYFTALLEDPALRPRVAAAFAEREGRVVAAGTFAHYKGGTVYLTGAVGAEGLEHAAHSLIQWDAVRKFNAQGARWFESGDAFPEAAEGKQKGLNDFKKSFGGRLVPRFAGRLRLPGWRARLWRVRGAW